MSHVPNNTFLISALVGFERWWSAQIAFDFLETLVF